MSRLPDWNDLATLLAIHEAGSLSGAARALGVSQSTISRRLAALEAEGVRVFVREDDGSLRVTPAGEAVLAAARMMDAAHKQAVAALTAAPQPLRIAACEVTARLFLTDAISGWTAQTDEPVDLLIHDDLFALSPTAWDVLVSPVDAPPEGQDGVRVGIMDFGLYAAPSYLQRRPLTAGANSLAGHRVIGASGGLTQVGAARWLDTQGGTVAFTASSPISQLEAAARGQGIALLPSAIADGDNRIVRLDYPGPAAAEVWMLASPRLPGNGRINRFIRWAKRRS